MESVAVKGIDAPPEVHDILREADVVLAGGAFRAGDEKAALAKVHATLPRGGTVAIWCPTLSSEAEIRVYRAAAADELDLPPIADPLAKGFRSFYAAPFAERSLRVVPAIAETTVAYWLAFERSRAEVRQAYGDRADLWLSALERRLLNAYGGPDATLRLRFLHYVYIGRA
jgi:hypothetical protein